MILQQIEQQVSESDTVRDVASATSNPVAVTAGLSEIAAGSIAVGLGGYLAARSGAHAIAKFIALTFSFTDRVKKEIMKKVNFEPGDGSGKSLQTRPVAGTDRSTLVTIARRAMIKRGFEPDFSDAAQKELAAIGGPAHPSVNVRDLRNLVWASIDNDDSRDLDQLSVAEAQAGGRVRILVAVADVDALVQKGSAIDAHASLNTTSIYTPAAIFPMLPLALSTDLTSLNADRDRLAVVADMLFESNGSLGSSDLYCAQVRNRAKLAYRNV